MDDRFPELRKHLAIYETIGVGGISSDEEDTTSKGPRRFISHRHHFISEDISRFGYHLDKLGDQFIRRKPYERVPGPPKTTTKWIKRLPVNGYDMDWYLSLKSYQREWLHAQGAHPFEF